MPVKQANKVIMDFDPKTKANLRKIYEQGEVRKFGKVTSTKLSRFELIPKSALIALADRFELGIVKKQAKRMRARFYLQAQCLPEYKGIG